MLTIKKLISALQPLRHERADVEELIDAATGIINNFDALTQQGHPLDNTRTMEYHLAQLNGHLSRRRMRLYNEHMIDWHFDNLQNLVDQFGELSQQVA